jgi:hypothetical protein
MDFRDWFVIALVTGAWTASLVFVFLHPTDGNFLGWCGLCATMGSIYHWLTIRDDKEKDAQ